MLPTIKEYKKLSTREKYDVMLRAMRINQSVEDNYNAWGDSMPSFVWGVDTKACQIMQFDNDMLELGKASIHETVFYDQYERTAWVEKYYNTPHPSAAKQFYYQSGDAIPF